MRALVPVWQRRSQWYDKIATIAGQRSGNEYTAADVRNVLKAWRKEYEERKLEAYRKSKRSRRSSSRGPALGPPDLPL